MFHALPVYLLAILMAICYNTKELHMVEGYGNGFICYEDQNLFLSRIFQKGNPMEVTEYGTEG